MDKIRKLITTQGKIIVVTPDAAQRTDTVSVLMP
jgi:hypothetical protein